MTAPNRRWRARRNRGNRKGKTANRIPNRNRAKARRPTPWPNRPGKTRNRAAFNRRKLRKRSRNRIRNRAMRLAPKRNPTATRRRTLRRPRTRPAKRRRPRPKECRRSKPSRGISRRTMKPPAARTKNRRNPKGSRSPGKPNATANRNPENKKTLRKRSLPAPISRALKNGPPTAKGKNPRTPAVRNRNRRGHPRKTPAWKRPRPKPTLSPVKTPAPTKASGPIRKTIMAKRNRRSPRANGSRRRKNSTNYRRTPRISTAPNPTRRKPPRRSSTKP